MVVVPHPGGAAKDVVAGRRVLPETARAWAATQGAGRFYPHPHISLPELAERLRPQAVAAGTAECWEDAWGRPDWSRLGDKRPGGRQGRILLVRAEDLGEELQTALWVSEQRGARLARLYLGGREAPGGPSSRRALPVPVWAHLDELRRTRGDGEGVGVRSGCPSRGS